LDVVRQRCEIRARSGDWLARASMVTGQPAHYPSVPTTEHLQMTTVRLFLTHGFLLLAMVSFGAGSSLATEPAAERFAEADGVADGRPAREPKAPIESPSVRYGLDLPKVPAVVIGPIDAGALLAEDAEDALLEPHKRLRISVGREVLVSPLDGQWDALPDGAQIWACDVVATGARALRLHFTNVELPGGTELAVYSMEGGPVHQYSGAEAQGGGEFWSATLAGERARVEFFVPAEMVGKTPVIPFMIDGVQHGYNPVIFRTDAANQDGADDGGIAGAGDCHNDVTCFQDWAEVAKAVGLISFIEGQQGFVCSGELLATVASDLTPYFLTAEHCIGTNAVAQTAEIFWLYQTAVCDGNPPNIFSVPSSDGASLLSAGANADYCLLMVDATIPDNLFWVGWTTAGIPAGTNTTCVHHPAGDYKRITFGNKVNGFLCGGGGWHVQLWDDGVAEGGSSGSGAYRDSDQKLYGILTCGASGCEQVPQNQVDSFGPFAVAFNSISELLNVGSDDALEENDSCSSPRFITAGTSTNLIVKSVDEDWYQFIVNQGDQVTLNLAFLHGNGDIDLQLLGSCGNVIGQSLTNSNSETINYTHSGSPAVLWARVFLDTDTRNTYTMTLGIVNNAPANDNCGGAISIPGGQTIISTAAATTSGPTEPLCNFGGNSQITNDVWYRYTAECTGVATISLCNSAFNTKLAVYGSSCPGASGSALACSDDSTLCGNDDASVELPVVQGQQYLLRIGSPNGTSGFAGVVIACEAGGGCAEDLSGDGSVGAADLANLLAAWGSDPGGPPDFNDNNTVGPEDLGTLLAAWGPCS
jgi:hypothetical protein